ncbi:MAG: recombination protein RecR, partial [Actinobacteria bacterium]|nr:recombination protein RecR [Actinomycetota bacterium]
MAGEIKPLRLKREPVPRAKPVATVENPVAKVLVDTGLLHIDQEFDFLVPQELAEIAVPGVLVKVPFNRKRVLGVIISRHPESEFRGELRFISEAIRPFPLLRANILALTAEVKRYYGGTRWDVIRFALPALSKGSRQLSEVIPSKSAHTLERDPRYPEGFWKALGELPTNESRIRTWWTPPPYEDPFEFLAALPAYSRSWSLVLLPDAHDVEKLASAITEAKALVQFCQKCFNFSEGSVCHICDDARRDQTVLCVVEESRDIVAIEKTGEFRGRYHVLLGAMNPLEGVGPEQLKIRELLARLDDEGITEIILCTNP